MWYLQLENRWTGGALDSRSAGNYHIFCFINRTRGSKLRRSDRNITDRKGRATSGLCPSGCTTVNGRSVTGERSFEIPVPKGRKKNKRKKGPNGPPFCFFRWRALPWYEAVDVLSEEVLSFARRQRIEHFGPRSADKLNGTSRVSIRRVAALLPP